jgi:hypothetical protein
MVHTTLPVKSPQRHRQEAGKRRRNAKAEISGMIE